jgi:hypothetical protein
VKDTDRNAAPCFAGPERARKFVRLTEAFFGQPLVAQARDAAEPGPPGLFDTFFILCASAPLR